MLSVKKQRTYYTDKKINAAKVNIEKYDWAKKIFKDTVSTADKYVELGIKRLYNMVLPQSIPRSYGVNQLLGCPVCKKAIDKFGAYPWLADPINHPWKLKCPSCKSVFPSNDFGAYYESGLGQDGIFDPKRADRKLLVNKLYPDQESDWCVDDGYGWINEVIKDPESNRYTFIAYYNHCFLWSSPDARYKAVISDAIDSLQMAYLLTDEARYVAPAVVLLDRIADFYPEMDSSVYKWSDGFRNSHGLSGKGKILGCIWEASFVKTLILAYDSIFPGIDQPQAVTFLSEASCRISAKDKKDSADKIKANIEKGILMQIYPALKAHQIRGNTGMHQSALAAAALVLDDDMISNEWIRYIFDSQETDEYGNGNLMSILVNNIDRDGAGDEASPSYNMLWLDNINMIADLLYEKTKDSSFDLYGNIKFRKMFHTAYPLILSNSYTPSIGDTKKAGDPGIIYSTNTHLSYYEKTGDVTAGKQYLNLKQAGMTDERFDIFADHEKISNLIKEQCGESQLVKDSGTLLAGYGFCAFDSDNKALWMYFGRNTKHGHRDTLNLGIYAFGMELMPDHGYPGFADNNMESLRWTKNTIAHNTVTVDSMPQNDHICGVPMHYEAKGLIRLMDVKAPKVYPQTKTYRRTTVWRMTDCGHPYAVDFFRIDGGSCHHFSFHAAEGDITVSGLDLVSQKEGTYAGDRIPVASSEYDKICQSGFNYLYDVRRCDDPEAAFSIDWAINDTWKVHERALNAHIKLTMLTELNEAVIAKGSPPRNKTGNPDFYEYLIAKRAGDNLKSCFCGVVEPYIDNSKIRSIDRCRVKDEYNNEVSYEAAAVRIFREDKKVDIIFCSEYHDRVFYIDDRIKVRGFFAVCSFIDQVTVSAYLCDGDMLMIDCKPVISSKYSAINGKIVDYTKELSMNNELIVRFCEPGMEDMAEGKYIYINNDEEQNAVYMINTVTETSNSLFSLDIGDMTLIRKQAGPDSSEGYIYNISEGAAFRIPQTYTWERKDDQNE